MQSNAQVQLYENFVPKWGKESVDLLTRYIDEKSNSNMKEELKDVATKADLQKMNEDVQLLKVDVQVLKVDVQYLKEDVQDIKRNIRSLEKQANEFVVLLKDTRAELIKWTFIFWSSQLTIFLGFMIFR